ncbi:hypothetical protein PUN28_010961 [Cardiocondyla obscurior]|uniref:Uncharacterized protein n=1 Tax=Cardiocondyla obscurior TaxID=286306 RepID=A0AAW2FIY3_9HYME
MELCEDLPAIRRIDGESLKHFVVRKHRPHTLVKDILLNTMFGKYSRVDSARNEKLPCLPFISAASKVCSRSHPLSYFPDEQTSNNSVRAFFPNSILESLQTTNIRICGPQKRSYAWEFFSLPLFDRIIGGKLKKAFKKLHDNVIVYKNLKGENGNVTQIIFIIDKFDAVFPICMNAVFNVNNNSHLQREMFARR